MKNILILAGLALFVVSCGTQKAAPVASAPVEAAPKTVALTPELEAGKNLYENNCAKCHKLYEPKKFTKEEWAPILVSMGKKAKLDGVQLASVTDYIHSQL
ncbi:cytochrome c5 [Flavobacterium nitrogenifigens]|uniref:Cytochrome c5 n=2 Tax=Flavobacterium TaxID=237 RepID=A0A7W7J0T9_9FLAO|nr:MULTISPECIES: c-type cytochrome [Flavobacterium]MBB4804127.1 cytochrome c5 [Flavobacterium nitrogenifigens]MBB6389086.1 cytochrome c5 [Flavobacterium notoginsengisoli]